MNILSFWASFKAYIILGALVLVLAALNILQWREAIQTETEHKEAVKLATAQAQLDIAQQTIEQIATMGAQKIKDDKELAALRARVPDTIEKKITVYVDRLRNVPIPVCEANAAQAAAINEVIHGTN